MSSYLCSDEVINRIVTHLALNRDLDSLRQEFLEAAHCTTDAELARTLFVLNIAAVTARYGAGSAASFRPLDYDFRMETASQLQVYRDAGELMYQCCEGSVPETSLYGLLTQLKAAVADAIIAGIGTRERELTAELENSLTARCAACCRGLDHDDEHCGAPTARRLLVGSRRAA